MTYLCLTFIWPTYVYAMQGWNFLFGELDNQTPALQVEIGFYLPETF